MNPIKPATTNNADIQNPLQNQVANTNVTAPENIDIQVSDVNKSMWHYILHKRLWLLLLLLPFAIGWEIISVLMTISYMNQNHGQLPGRGMVYIYLTPYILFALWLAAIKKRYEAVFLAEFAQANNYTFEKNGAVDKTYGSLFRIDGTQVGGIFRVNRAQTVSDVVSGSYHNNPIRLFLHSIQVGRSSVETTVLEVDVGGKLPSLLLTSKKAQSQSYYLNKSFGTKESLSLEGDFNKYFQLYGNPKNKVEALEVFSPDVMALLEDSAQNLCVEFAANRIYLYKNGYISNINDLTHLFAVAKRLVEKIEPLSERLKGDNDIVLPTPNAVTIQANIQKIRWGLVLYLGFIGFVAFIMLLIGVFAIIAAANSSPDQPTDAVNSSQTSQTAVSPSPQPYKAQYPSPSSTTSASGTIRVVGDSSTTTNTPDNVQNAADILAYQWLWNLQQHNFSTSYGLEDREFQQKYNLKEQSHMYANIYPMGYVAMFQGNIIGQRADGKQTVAIVYKVNYPPKPSVSPTYVEIYVTNESGVLYVTGKQGSTNQLSPNIPK